MKQPWLVVTVFAFVVFFVLDRWLLGGWGFYAVFGFVSTVLIVVVSKFLGKIVIQKPEDYYERGVEDA